MKTRRLLLLSVCILTTVCAFAQNETRRFSERENRTERENRNGIFFQSERENRNEQEARISPFSMRENAKPELRRNRTQTFTPQQTNVVTHQLDSMIGVWTYHGDEGKIKTAFTYDDNGNLIMEIFYEWENNEWIGYWKEKFAFDNNGNRIMRAFYWWKNNEWIRGWKGEFVFDNNGNLIAQIFCHYRYFGNNQWFEDCWGVKFELTFDDNGNMITRIHYGYEKEEFVFDDNGNLIMRIFYWWENNEWIEEFKLEYTFDNHGNMIMLIIYRWDEENNEWREVEKSEFAFDNHGNLTVWAFYWRENNAWRRGGEFTFEFDLSVLSVFSMNTFPAILEIDGVLTESFFYNKPVRSRWHFSWQEIVDWTFYYSTLSTNNVPTIPATSISVFPNPASYHFTISGITENTLVSISNLTGQIVLQQIVSPSESVSVNHLPAGIYIVRINGESQRLIVR